jgi:hypothetical protein
VGAHGGRSGERGVGTGESVGGMGELHGEETGEASEVQGEREGEVQGDDKKREGESHCPSSPQEVGEARSSKSESSIVCARVKNLSNIQERNLLESTANTSIHNNLT